MEGAPLPTMTATLAPAPGRVDDDAELVVHARAGSRVAMTSLHRKYAPMVHAIVLARVPAQDADDLVQDVFIQAMGRLASLREPGAFGGWLATITRNAARDHHRRKRPLATLADDAAASPPRGPARHDAIRALERMQALPMAQREVLIMRLVEGMSGPEIAARTGQSHGSVRVMLHRGLAALRADLSEDDP